jgi:CMP-N-acetylneuraminic acid synthetase
MNKVKKDKLKIYAMIPARYGSVRLKMKNLALINNTPMIGYAIQAAIKSNMFDRVVVNSEHEIFKSIASRYNVDFYHRPDNLGSSEAKSDSIVADFMNFYPEADIVVWINPISPFQTQKEISDVVEYFVQNNLDSLITVEDKQVHCNYENKPVNYDKNQLFAQTQSLKPVQLFVYSIMMWRSDKFLLDFFRNGHALFCGNFGTYPVSKLSGIIVKTADDLKLADILMRSIVEESGRVDYEVQYDDLVK